MTLKMPDGTNYEIPLLPKTFSSDSEGFYATNPYMIKRCHKSTICFDLTPDHLPDY